MADLITTAAILSSTVDEAQGIYECIDLTPDDWDGPDGDPLVEGLWANKWRHSRVGDRFSMLVDDPSGLDFIAESLSKSPRKPERELGKTLTDYRKGVVPEVKEIVKPLKPRKK